MVTFKTSKQVLEECKRDALFKLQEDIDLRKIRTMLALATSELRTIQKLSKQLAKDDYEASTIFKLHYDVLHQLVEAFIRFDHIKSLNHHCLFAHLIEKHPELELHWNILEEIRTKRNGIQYYGTPIKYSDWKRLELPLTIYINILKKAVEEKLKTEK